MSVTNIKQALDKKQQARMGCRICNERHDGKCKRGDLIFRIENLLKANSLIPQLMGSNKEAVDHAVHLQSIVKKFDEAHTMLMEVFSNHGEVGEKIKNEYMGRLEEWAKKHLNRDTSEEEQLELFGQENSTSEEKQIRDFTKQPSGSGSENDSLSTTQNATAADKPLQ